MNKIGVILCALKGENLPFYSTKYKTLVTVSIVICGTR